MGTSAESAKRFADSQNIQKRIVESDELGAMSAMLSSDAASAVTGQVISAISGSNSFSLDSRNGSLHSISKPSRKQNGW